MHDWTKTTGQTINIAFLLFDGFSNLCLANCVEPLRATNTLTGRDAFEWRFFTMTGAGVLSSSAMQIMPHGPLSSLSHCDYLFVLASYGHESHDAGATRNALRRLPHVACTLVGLDTAPWLLAAAGLLDGRRATLHWDILGAFSERFLTVHLEKAHVIKDGSIITCAGAMAALDLSLGLVNDHAGIAARLDVEALFISGGTVRDPGEAPRGITDPLVRTSIKLMRDNLEKPLTLAEISSRVSCQPRTLDRRCRAVVGMSPGRLYRHLRLSAARKLLQESSLSMAEISVRCGYDSQAALARAVKQQFDATPTQLRKRPTI
ncbi:GlxA family transcriptional regulator [Roseovarius sp. SYSU LYC5161]|uniref:GlxA family transcriptional regulator n=1 Tax=Roseovarius halophilus (ex Wu et al. 2025) TaxID=3376060 RepID=UPI0039999512